MADLPELLPVETGYKKVLRARLALMWLVLTAGALIAGYALAGSTRFAMLIPAAVLLAGLLAVATVPARIHRRLRYGLSERLLQVVRGWLFHTDTVVPLVRVQHLDVVRGPFDKMFGTATLVLHTAGTHNSTVTVPGLAPERAEAMRDIIRDHVRTDFA
ncbi:PH domain-containing protein [Sphingomonas segetis]|jgi:membrane protein YdbS with pleckstrin-like domain|uniref:PH domain-containing protein n=1 Tax=Sphingomonas segetis TaxID=1104779 RepID=UPI0012D2AF1E|nr:PH domain-containing protein [Sphingomonas segetis]